MLFIGNSITLHEKAPSIGWDCEWGMAASSQDKDYVHQVLATLRERFGEIAYCIVNAATFWECEAISAPMKEVAIRLGTDFISISDLGYHDENKVIGLFEHKGVASHPGDLGMRRIAERILQIF